jgi:hypothetical protein
MKNHYITIEDIDRVEITLGVKWSNFKKKKILFNVNWFKSKDENFNVFEYLREQSKNFVQNNFLVNKI